jgi:hypothetical protein
MIQRMSDRYEQKGTVNEIGQWTRRTAGLWGWRRG